MECGCPLPLSPFWLRHSDCAPLESVRISAFGVRICDSPSLRPSCDGTAWHAQWDGPCDGLGHLRDGFGTPNGTAKILNVCRLWDGGTPDLSPVPRNNNPRPKPLSLNRQLQIGADSSSQRTPATADSSRSAMFHLDLSAPKTRFFPDSRPRPPCDFQFLISNLMCSRSKNCSY